MKPCWVHPTGVPRETSLTARETSLRNRIRSIVRDMHARMLQCPPPLGPGAPGVERLAAFTEAYMKHIIGNLDLVLLTEASSPRGRFDRVVYPFWRRHVEILVEEIDTETPRLRAEAIMSVLVA